IVYMSSRLFSDATFQRKLPQRLRHRKWLKLSLPELAPKAATFGPALTAEFAQLLPGFGSPVSHFRALGKRPAAGKIDRGDGVEARGYSEKVDFRPYLDVLPRLVRQIIARSSSRMDALIWVDGTSNVRRILLTSAPIRGANGAQMSDATDVGHLGGRVTIRVPPRGEVLDTLSLPKT